MKMTFRGNPRKNFSLRGEGFSPDEEQRGRALKTQEEPETGFKRVSGIQDKKAPLLST